MNVNVFSMNVLIGDTIFKSPAGDGTTILRGHQSHAKLFAGQRQYFHFSVMLIPWVLVWSQESNLRPPALQSSTLTNWANPLLRFGNTIHFISERSAMWIWWNGSKKVSYCVLCTQCRAIFMILERLSFWSESILVLFTRYWTTFHSCVQVIAFCTNDVTNFWSLSALT